MILPEHSCHSDVGDVPICMKYFLVLPLTTFPPTTTQQKTHNLFWPDENSIEQCCAAHIVQGCQQY